MTKTIRTNSMVDTWITEKENFNQYIIGLIISDMRADERGLVIISVHSIMSDLDDIIEEYSDFYDDSYEEHLSRLYKHRIKLLKISKKIDDIDVANSVIDKAKKEIEKTRDTIEECYIEMFGEQDEI